MFAAFAVWMMLHGPAEKPKCAKVNDGLFWPIATNYSPAERREAVRAGQLEICGYGDRGYHWTKPGVAAKDIQKTKFVTSRLSPSE
jgi:hypothetical protein